MAEPPKGPPTIDGAILRSGVLTGLIVSALFLWNLPNTPYEMVWCDYFDGMKWKLPLWGGTLSAALLGVRKDRPLGSALGAALIAALILVAVIFGYPRGSAGDEWRQVYHGYTEDELAAGMVLMSPQIAGAALASAWITTLVRNRVHRWLVGSARQS